MRFFGYRAIDKDGRIAEGTIQAASSDDARRMLAGAGMRVSGLHEMGGQAPRPVPARPGAVAAAPVARPVAVAATAPVTSFRYRFAGNMTSFFFFDGLGRYLRSGIAPSRALEELGQRSRQAWMSERLMGAAAAVGKGISLADALEACVCFPTGCIGTIRAGEASGAVPDACVQAAAGCESAHKLWIKTSFILLTLVLAISFWPLGKGLIDGSLGSMEKQWNSDGSLPAVGTAAQTIGGELRKTYPPAILTGLMLFGLWRFWLSMPMRMARHKAILVIPILAGRAREESLARSSWALTELSRAGLPPNRALAFAADACPNLEMARRFREESARMREQDRLSTALANTGLLNPQLVDVIHNGEVAGDVPGAIDSVHRATGAEFQRKDQSASTRIYFVIYPIIAVIVAVMVGVLYKTLIMGEFRIIQ